MQRIIDPDVQALATIAASLEGDYRKTSDVWINSPFAWIREGLPSRSKGKIGEQLVSKFLEERGIEVVPCRDSQADRIINGHRAEIKFSTLWESGILKFQQLRDQDYEFAICLGLCPCDARCWIVPKQELLRHVIGHTGQHGGAGGTDTAWMSFAPDQPYEWL